MSIKQLIALARPEIRQMQAYESARSLNLQAEVLLDANESPRQIFTDDPVFATINRYPEPQSKCLLTKLAKLYQVKEKQIFMGRGSDDAIDALIRVFCGAGKDSIIICPPTYGVYQVNAQIQGAKIRSVPLLEQDEGNWHWDIDGILKYWSPESKLLFLCSPNNPTGSSLPPDKLKTLCQSLTGKALVVLDEAYIEFSRFNSMTPLLAEFPNLIILRTLSKAWSLAGARCGFALGHPEILDLLHKVRAPYPLSTPALNTVLKALSGDGPQRCQQNIDEILSEKKSLGEQLAKLTLVEKIYTSDANFLLIKVSAAKRLTQACQKVKILLRLRGDNLIRISVGSKPENQRVIALLRSCQ